MKQIIHFSDLHIGYGNLGRRFDVICNNLIFEKASAEDYVVVITGDLDTECLVVLDNFLQFEVTGASLGSVAYQI